LDKDGFVLTGADSGDKWTADRPPHDLETSRPGIFSAGDVRSGSVKRVAAAAIQAVHQYLAHLG
jgi:thioredoxin reductase (NADPH)